MPSSFTTRIVGVVFFIWFKISYIWFMLAAEKKKYTVDDYMMLEEGAPFQLINYDLIISPAPIPLHQLIFRRIVVAMSNFLDDKNDNGFLVYAAYGC
jgi:hypothetical protein